MASIFTYDPDPPRVSSPWLNSLDKKNTANQSVPISSSPAIQVQSSLLSETGVTKLEAEPQEGPTEYKLHLLLRPRRKYQFTSTSIKKSITEGRISKYPSPNIPPTQSRQARLEQLTTQLLWRLQQSSPYHASSSNEIVIPQLPSDNVGLNDATIRPAALIPGLEESRGALYEIGVADDGTLIGLTEDEMRESLHNLKVMAASLGCKVERLREIIVGDCEWIETIGLMDSATDLPQQALRKAQLWVCEAFVSPDLGQKDELSKYNSETETPQVHSEPVVPKVPSSITDQLRITLTGPTTSGKSTLLGTLAYGTLDNGRGKSRLSLLKHRHEVASGMTSAMSPELIGYKDGQIFNYTNKNIESWIDIHDRSQDGRLVFVSDSAGHPRYRRTILRGLVGWAPHWTVLCIAADEFEATAGRPGATSSALDVLGSDGASIDLVQAHLDLCLKMEVPLAIAITKLDLASRPGLNKTLGRVLTAIKDRGRVPRLIAPNQKSQSNLAEIPQEDIAAVNQAVGNLLDSGDLLKVVPIVITSTVTGCGIGQIHALFQRLSLPPIPTAHDYVGMSLNPEQPTTLFHVDDTFRFSSQHVSLSPGNSGRNDPDIVLSGYLRFGKLSIGDHVVIGPFPADEDDAQVSGSDPSQGSPNRGLSISHPCSAELFRIAIRNAVSASAIKGEWHNAHITSVRNLRLPVHTLKAGQAGTIGIHFDMLTGTDGSTPPIPRVRRGMVLAIPSVHMMKTGLNLQAASSLTAVFDDDKALKLSVGSLINIYVAAVRAACKVIRVSPGRFNQGTVTTEEIDDVFDLEPEPSHTATLGPSTAEVTIELLTNREWIELGSKIVVLEGGSKDKSGLEGLVGKVVEIVD